MPRFRLLQPKQEKTFWITNISNKIVSLSDLAIHIQPYSSINLLDSHHYHLTDEQIFKSTSSGSICKKSDKIKIRLIPPQGKEQIIIPIDHDAVFPSRKRSTVEIDDIHYEELDVSDDNYAEENAELAETDRTNRFNK
jgi:hypothetical protein